MQFEQAIKIMAQLKDPIRDNPVNGVDVANDVANTATNSVVPAAGDGLPGMSQLAGMLGEHKGKLAIGVAATLGLMVFYSWREKRLAREDPEAHALHQRSKAIVKAAEAGRFHDPGRPADTQPEGHARRGEEDVLPR